MRRESDLTTEEFTSTKITTTFRINELFHSLQGEGANQGKEVIFIRLAGCNLTCSWCDTQHDPYTEYSITTLMETISQWNCKSVIITGGEPSIHNLTPLLKTLKGEGYWIAIESNATKSLSEFEPYLDFIALSPKGVIKQTKADEIRVVNDKQSVQKLLLIEKAIKANYYFISPLEVNGQFNIMASLELLGQINAISHNKWFISIQLHKLAGIR